MTDTANVLKYKNPKFQVNLKFGIFKSDTIVC